MRALGIQPLSELRTFWAVGGIQSLVYSFIYQIFHVVMPTSCILLGMYHFYHMRRVSQIRKYLKYINCGGSHDKIK